MPHQSRPRTPVRGEPGPATSPVHPQAENAATRHGGRAAHSRTPPAPRPPYPPRQPTRDGTRTSFVATKRHSDPMAIFERHRVRRPVTPSLNAYEPLTESQEGPGWGLVIPRSHLPDLQVPPDVRHRPDRQQPKGRGGGRHRYCRDVSKCPHRAPPAFELTRVSGPAPEFPDRGGDESVRELRCGETSGRAGFWLGGCLPVSDAAASGQRAR